MKMILISEDENYELILEEVRRQDEYNNLTIGVFDLDADIILVKAFTQDISYVANTEGNLTLRIGSDGYIYEYDYFKRLFLENPVTFGYIRDNITMLIWSQPKPSNYDFVIHQMKAIKSMTEDKLIHRHIDATLKEINKGG
ncbi:hypothetical protein HOT02_gp038 [Staphylococcus phage phiSA_BS2]|uniref:Uncharacterized protein n=1 Tax=Staphylococcus phage phiSA_BS2 TaxID=2126724 RepID=A0A2R3ZXN1_9CAUD|nr:hypothetical protein HOT02_gp038 [Staphylococcus phage phiSA_BS2]AVR55483.1 hypothetical protein phiSABS2_38 [Staphylococcus phage phiSA_BS2]